MQLVPGSFSEKPCFKTNCVPKAMPIKWMPINRFLLFHFLPSFRWRCVSLGKKMWASKINGNHTEGWSKSLTMTYWWAIIMLIVGGSTPSRMSCCYLKCYRESQLQLFLGSNCIARATLHCAYLLSGVWLFVTPWTIDVRLLCPWGFSRQEYSNGLPCPPPGDLPTQGSNPGLPHCRQVLYCLSHQRSPRILEWVAYPFSRGSSQPRNRTGVSCVVGSFFTSWATVEAQSGSVLYLNWLSPQFIKVVSVKFLIILPLILKRIDDELLLYQ